MPLQKWSQLDSLKVISKQKTVVMASHKLLLNVLKSNDVQN
jgi:hypothetical protein